MQPILLMRSIIAFSTFLLLNSAFAANQTHYASEHHRHITINPKLSVTDVLALTVERTPRKTLTTGRQANAKHERQLSNLWFSNRPKLTFSHWDAINQNDESVIETTLGVELNIRSRRERAQSETVADITEKQVLLWQDFLRWQLQGELYRLLFDIERAQINVQTNQQHLAATRRLQQISQVKMSAGELSRQSVTQSEIHSLQAEQALISAEAELVDAEREYRVFTGIAERPSVDHIELAPDIRLSNEHPQLLLLRSELAIRKAKLSHRRHQNKGTASVELGIKRERDSTTNEAIETVGIGVKLPIGSSKYSYSDNYDLVNSVAQAESELQQQKRYLDQTLHELQHTLKVLDKNIKLNAKQVALSHTQVERVLKAFELGETEINAVIRAQINHQNTNALSQTARLEQQHLIHMTHHTMGHNQ